MKTKETKFTPGPWTIHNNIGKKSELGIIASDAPCVILTMCGTKEWPAITKANARLIACAPELLATLSLFVDCVDGKYDELVELAKPLLQRARGECDHILDFGKCRFCGFIDDSIINH